MPILAALGLVFAGIALLAFGGDWLIRGATALARFARVSPAVIGLTVVAMGTSLPELVVSLVAVLNGSADMAVGNVVGSNLFNIAGILGLTALFVAIPVHGSAVRLEWPFMFVASCLALLLVRDGSLDRLEGGFFVIALVLFIIYTVRLAREVTVKEAEGFAGAVEELTAHRGLAGLGGSVGLVAAGIVLLVAGGRMLVVGAVALATQAGVSERVIGITVVALGTSLPELAASLTAAYRRQTEMALANVIGSNIFNLLGILGLTALVRPVQVAREIISFDMWWMLVLSALLLPVMRTRHRVGRGEAAVLASAYGVYLVFLLR